MNWNLLAQWIGEAGSGSWGSFREAYLWSASAVPDDGKEPPHRVALRMAGLAYMEIDWDDGKWCAAEPCLTLLPSAGGSGLLAGGRTRHLLRRLDDEVDPEVNIHVVLHRQPQDRAPDTLYFSADLDELEKLAKRLEVRFEHSIAERISLVLPHIDDIISLGNAAPPPQGFEINKWAAPGMQLVHDTHVPGLYRGGAFGRPRYWLIDRGLCANVDGPTGFHAELRRLGRRELRYKHRSVNGSLFRPVWAPLPLLQERAAVMCSGLAPLLVNPNVPFIDRRIRYANVPLRIARRIASSLDTELEILL